MSAVIEMVDLAREVQGIDVRLGLIGAEPRNIEFRRDLEERRALAAERLAKLEAEHGLVDEVAAEEPEDTAGELA